MTDDHQKLSKQAFLDEANTFLEQLSSESDRGAVLAGVSYIEELLLRLFKAKLLLTKELGGYLFEGSGALATFSARIKVAYCLGWIGPEMYHDLDLMRLIRNECAHVHTPVKFNARKVQDRCRQLKALNMLLSGKLATAKDQFLFSAAILVLRLDYLKRDAKAPAAGIDPPVKPLSTKLQAQLSGSKVSVKNE